VIAFGVDVVMFDVSGFLDPAIHHLDSLAAA
jgi:hypothetical protein